MKDQRESKTLYKRKLFIKHIFQRINNIKLYGKNVHIIMNTKKNL